MHILVYQRLHRRNSVTVTQKFPKVFVLFFSHVLPPFFKRIENAHIYIAFSCQTSVHVPITVFVSLRKLFPLVSAAFTLFIYWCIDIWSFRFCSLVFAICIQSFLVAGSFKYLMSVSLANSGVFAEQFRSLFKLVFNMVNFTHLQNF